MPRYESERRPSLAVAHAYHWSTYPSKLPLALASASEPITEILTPPWDDPEKKARYRQAETRILCLVLRDVDNRLRQTERGKLLPDALQGPEELQYFARHILDRTYAAMPSGWHLSTPQAILDGDFESIVDAVARDSIMLYVDMDMNDRMDGGGQDSNMMFRYKDSDATDTTPV